MSRTPTRPRTGLVARRPSRSILVGLTAVAVVAGGGLAMRLATDGGDSHGAASDAHALALPESRLGGQPAQRSWTPWPQAQHDAQHTGAATQRGPSTDHVRWERDLGDNVTPGPVIGAEGTIYAATNAGVLHALDPATGRTVWTLDTGHAYGNDLSTSPAVLPDGTILWPGPHRQLLAVSPEGRELWRLGFTGQPTSPAVDESGDVVVGDTAGSLVGLHPSADGPGVRWRWSGHEASYGSAVLSADGRTAYQSLTSGVVAVVDGVLVWRWRVPSQIVEVSPAVTPDGDVVIGTNDPYEYRLDGATGAVVWRYRRGFWTYSSPGVTRDGLAYFGDHSDTVAAVDARTGQIRFRFRGDQTDDGPGGIGIWTSVLVDAAHTVYVGTRQGLVYAVAASGRRLWQLDLGATIDSYPALTADGTLIVGTTDGRLLAIGSG